jgi:hypothetical protein
MFGSTEWQLIFKVGEQCSQRWLPNNYWGYVLNMTLSSVSDSIYLQMKYKTEIVGYPLSTIPFVIFNGEPIEVSNSDFIEEACVRYNVCFTLVLN